MTGERRLRPPPDLDELARKHGGYSRITAEGWAWYDREIERWKDDVRNGRAEMDEGDGQ
jgi:hypothetical protein